MTDFPALTKALLLTDLVDSAGLAARLGDAALAQLSAAHDRLARDLLHRWQGLEIDKTDGFLLLFDRADQALAYAMAYHQALAGLEVPMQARAGLHVGEVSLRVTPPEDVARGAKPLEVDGLSKPLAARVMATAQGGQTLLTAAAVAALVAIRPLQQRLVSHGHWRIKGLPEPIELFETGPELAPFRAPADHDKAYRVVAQGALWLPAREIRHTLPAERDAFVGRSAVLRELSRRFDSGARLISLLGIGGGGKTRLATHFAWQTLGDFPGGAWFCDLAPARDAEGIAYAVAQGLEVPLDKGDPVAQLGHAIAARGPCLILLDNFEQVARYAEATLGRWLARASKALFLVTTREVLDIVGEEALALGPLPPAEGEALFLRRAAAARSDFAPQPADLAAVGPLVRLLDGLPLAIELAAARVRTLLPTDLLERMSERFKLLTSTGNRLDRQATLRAAFDWSWDLLSDADKAALAQLSVFEAGFTLEAAQAVLSLGPGPQAPSAETAVHSLVDKSFVRALGEQRFDLLMNVQAYAAEHLQTEGRFAGSSPAALAAAQARHAAWFASLGPARATESRCADLDNLVLACRRSIAAGQAALAAGALTGAWAALALHGPYATGAELARQLCDLPGLAGAAAAEAHAAWGHALEAQGQRPAAQAQFEAVLACLPADDLSPCGLQAQVRLHSLRARLGDVEQARRDLNETAALARRAGQAEIEGAALNGLGISAFEHGQMVQAAQHFEAALDLARSSGQRRLQCLVLGNLGSLHATVGQPALARQACEETLLIARALGDRKHEGNTLSNLGLLCWQLGQVDQAATHCEAALAVARDLGHLRLECTVRCNLGLVRDAQGRVTEALVQLDDALALARRNADRRAEGQVLGHLGLVQARLGRLEAGRKSLADGQAILRELSDPISLGILLCCQAETEALAGDEAACTRAQHEAAALAGAAGAGAESELGVALARLDQRLAAAHQGPLTR